MIRELSAIIKKNFLSLSRSKTSTTIVLLSPLILIFFMGLGVTDSYSNVDIGLIAEDNSSDLYSVLSGTSGLNFYKMLDENSCIDNVKEGKYEMCIKYNGKGESTDMYIDISKANLAYAILDMISGKFSSASTEASVSMIQDVFTQLIQASNNMDDQSSSIENIKKQIKNIPLKLKSIKEGIGNFSVEVNYDEDFSEDIEEADEDIDDYEEELDEQYEKNRKKLIETRENITENKKDLQEKKKERDRYIQSIDESWELNNCSGKDYIYMDLDNPEIPEGYDETCSALYTLRKAIMQNTKDLDESIKTLENAERMINSSLVDLYYYKDEMEQVLEKAEEMVNDAESANDEIEELIDAINKKSENFKNFKEKSFNNISNIQNTIDKNIQDIDIIKEKINKFSSKVSSLSEVNTTTLADPFSTNFHHINQSKNQLDYFFPGLLIMVILFTSMLLSGLMIIKERKSPSFFRNIILPPNNNLLLIGILITVLIISSLQSIIITLIAKMFFNVSGIEKFSFLILIFLMASVLFSLLGLLLANILHSQDSFVVTGIILCILLFMLSGTVIPLELMAQGIYTFAKMNPFVLIESMIKNVMIYNINPFTVINIYLYIIEVFSLGLMIMIIFFFKTKNSNI
ncbi:MAG: ABC transporter permease [Nanobdellota archaeon]